MARKPFVCKSGNTFKQVCGGPIQVLDGDVLSNDEDEGDFPPENDGRPYMFGPLSFDDLNEETDDSKETDCILCDDKFNLKYSMSIFLQHVLQVHHLVIDKVQYIEDLEKYILFWKAKFKEKGLDFYTPFLTFQDSEKYHLLSDDLATDRKLRFQISLDFHLKKQHFERSKADFKRKCLLCRLTFEGTRHGYLNHLSEVHNMQLGNPQNLVHIEELVNILEEKIDELQCIYCEKHFPDRVILKEHMRKKVHKRINADNKNYDKYYMINYLEEEPCSLGGKYEEKEDFTMLRSGLVDDDEFVDWLEDEEFIYCLFCKVKETDLRVMFDHVRSCHHFDLEKEMEELDFYKKIKIVNYIRKQTFQRACLFCDLKCRNVHVLRDHMEQEGHCKLPEESVYNQPEYYFPTFENDTLLYLLDDGDDIE